MRKLKVGKYYWYQRNAYSKKVPIKVIYCAQRSGVFNTRVIFYKIGFEEWIYVRSEFIGRKLNKLEIALLINEH